MVNDKDELKKVTKKVGIALDDDILEQVTGGEEVPEPPNPFIKPCVCLFPVDGGNNRCYICKGILDVDKLASQMMKP